jgi:hypothetical protein
VVIVPSLYEYQADLCEVLKIPPETADSSPVGVSYLAARLSALRSVQNPDGGWGYFPGKRSWLEPTAYATLTLHGDPAADRAWALIRSWQGSDGSWRPSAEVHIEHWDTALCVTLAVARGDFGEPFRKGVEWLLNSAGVESNMLSRIAAGIGLLDTGRDLSLKGWPWKPGTSSWVEPTAHTLVALKKASAKIAVRELRDRVRMGEAQLLDVRGKDGGWNYGSREALEVDLPSYPETTALALVGLQGHAGLEGRPGLQGRTGMPGPIEVAVRMLRGSPSPLARAWLTIALRLHGVEVPATLEEPHSPDVLITALEALGSPEGNFALLKTGAVA